MSTRKARGIAWVVSVVLLPVAGAAPAATFEVTKAGDSADGVCDADCSLREAIRAANGTPGADIIRLPHAFYRLSVAGQADDDNAGHGDLDITDDLVLRGLPDGSTIDADGIDRVIEVLPGVKAELIDLTLREGAVLGRGGGIYTAGDLTLRRVKVLRNRAGAAPVDIMQGGGIFNLGVLRIIHSIIDQNIARDDVGWKGGRGGGIFNGPGAQLYMYDTNVRDNLTGLDDVFGEGAGLFNWGQARIDRSFFGRNDPGDGEGGAMANRDGASLTVINTTVSANGHDGALGAIANGSEHQTETEPQSKLYLTNVTIANNNGGGLFNTGRVTMRNTIVAGNYTQDALDRWYDAGLNCVNRAPGDITQTHALIGADGNCLAYIYVDNRSVFDVVLDHLRYIGGPTPVHYLKPGSPAIDSGNDAVCPAVDQRQGRRPADGDMDDVETCDIGAVELGADE
ncbi:MAG: CSLREA domain-containing protein [Pseudomonadota bacterium]